MSDSMNVLSITGMFFYAELWKRDSVVTASAVKAQPIISCVGKRTFFNIGITDVPSPNEPRGSCCRFQRVFVWLCESVPHPRTPRQATRSACRAGFIYFILFIYFIYFFYFICFIYFIYLFYLFYLFNYSFILIILFI